jgi:hypothetical protein
MDIPSRVIFAFLFLLALLGNMIAAKGASVILPVTAAKAQGRSSATGAVTGPALVGDGIQMDERPWVGLSDHDGNEKIPCESLQITAAGAVCDGYRLEFPEVIMKAVLEGDRHLPRQSGFVSASKKVVGGAVYRNLTLGLRWEPATPEFLQIHLEEYLPYWGGRIPYRLFWDAQYEMCSESCAAVYEKGEILPADIEDLSPYLAADVNFNGLPAAFWNENIQP